MDRLRIICTGLIGSIPMAGLTMHYLQYVLGLRALGHEVLYLEDTGTWNYDPDTDSMTADASSSIKYLAFIMKLNGLEEAWTFVDHTGNRYGVVGRPFDEFLRTADLFLNVTGAGIVRDEFGRIPVRAYVDTDPGFIQMRVANGSRQDVEHLERHTCYFSFGHNIGSEGCLIPVVGLDWLPSRQPIVSECWPIVPAPAGPSNFTTILKWQTYDAVEHAGQSYGLKNDEFLKFLDLPGRVSPRLELAVAGEPPTENLEAKGWLIRRARDISDTVEHYRSYIQGSKAEWSIAKSAYVKTNSGWFSDRSAAYLASGRPVVLQSTGYEDWLETGRGLLSFRDPDEAATAIEDISSKYALHCRAAVAIAQEVFGAREVLSDLLARATA